MIQAQQIHLYVSAQADKEIIGDLLGSDYGHQTGIGQGLSRASVSEIILAHLPSLLHPKLRHSHLITGLRKAYSYGNQQYAQMSRYCKLLHLSRWLSCSLSSWSSSQPPLVHHNHMTATPERTVTTVTMTTLQTSLPRCYISILLFAHTTLATLDYSCY